MKITMFAYWSILLLLQHLSTLSQPLTPGKSYFSESSYIEYIHGNMPLIISVPHGGYEIPEDIPEREGRVAKNQDIYTIKIAQIIKDSIYARTGEYPFIIINHIHRTRLDANRSIVEAAKGNKEAEKIWNEFHDRIVNAKETVNRHFGTGLLIDLHGHRHKDDRIELGYMLSGEELRLDPDFLNSGLLNEYLSIRRLASDNAGMVPLDELIRGPASLGAMIEKRGQKVVPSPGTPYPLEGERFFSGGYNTGRHGSSKGGSIDAIQIEIGLVTRTVPQLREEVARDIAFSLLEFLSTNYFPEKSEHHSGWQSETWQYP
ncbi:MAG: hypothetical protein K9G38_03415 [Bacteroidales bacterium]|nr:hypothetical protein [Bacteroidales bacterium]